MIVVITHPPCVHCNSFMTKVAPNLTKYPIVVIPLSELYTVFGPKRIDPIASVQLSLPCIMYVKNEEIYKLESHDITSIETRIQEINTSV